MFLATELKIDEIKSNEDMIDKIADKIKGIGSEITTANSNLDEMLAELDTTKESAAEQTLSPRTLAKSTLPAISETETGDR